MVTIIQSIFCAQSGASIRLTVWKWSFESRYPWALPPVLENFRGAFSPGPTDCPWVSEDELKQTPLEVSQSAVSLLEDCPLSFQLLGRRNSLLTRTELLFLMICFMVFNILPSQTPLVSTTTNQNIIQVLRVSTSNRIIDHLFSKEIELGRISKVDSKPRCVHAPYWPST